MILGASVALRTYTVSAACGGGGYHPAINANNANGNATKHADPSDTEITDPAYLAELAQVHIRYNSLDRAAVLLRASIEKGKDPVQTQQASSTLAEILQRKGDFKAAAVFYEQSLKSVSNPGERAVLQMALAEDYIQVKEFEKAEALLLAATAPGNDSPLGPNQWQRQHAYSNLIQIWRQQPGRLEKAIEDAEQVLVQKPNDTATLERLAEIYTTAKIDPAKAAQNYEKLLALHPSDQALQRKVMALYQQAGQIDKLADMGKKRIAAAPNKDEARMQALQTAQSMLRSGKKDDTARWLKENYSIESASSRDYSNLGGFYEQAGLDVEAEAALSKAIELGANREERAEGALRLAECKIRRNENGMAEELLNGVLKENGGNPGLMARANAALARIKGTGPRK